MRSAGEGVRALEVVRRYGYTIFMDKVTRLLHDMVEAGIITDYAVFGAVAQMRYTEAVVTLDADILVADR